MCFNSILVRLKAEGRRIIAEVEAGFNSILVRLKAGTENGEVCDFTGFNSILVRLKASLVSPQSRDWRGFNSILVRLKGAGESWLEYMAYWFQFHSGTIKRHCTSRQQTRPTQVSIPFWYD